MNPVSGVSKISQALFATVSSSVPGNLVAGAISEAGAMQSGDLMQVGLTGRCWGVGGIMGTSPLIVFPSLHKLNEKVGVEGCLFGCMV